MSDGFGQKAALGPAETLALESAVAEEERTRAARVAALREQYRAGTYHVDEQAVAAALTEEHLDRA